MVTDRPKQKGEEAGYTCPRPQKAKPVWVYNFILTRLPPWASYKLCMGQATEEYRREEVAQSQTLPVSLTAKKKGISCTCSSVKSVPCPTFQPPVTAMSTYCKRLSHSPLVFKSISPRNKSVSSEPSLFTLLTIYFLFNSVQRFPAHVYFAYSGAIQNFHWVGEDNASSYRNSALHAIPTRFVLRKILRELHLKLIWL